jgi:hypothetical protein
MKPLLMILAVIIWPLGAFLVQRSGAARPFKIGAWIAAAIWVLIAIAPRTPSAPREPTESAAAEAQPTRTPRPEPATRTPRPGPAPTPNLEQRQAAAQWEEFARYGPALATVLNSSDEISRRHAAAAGLVSPATIVEFYRVTEAAEGAHDRLRSQAMAVSVPREGTDFKNGVRDALGERRDAMKKLKEALNRPGVGASAAYADAKRDVDRSTLALVTKLFTLCNGMGATPDECTGLLGWTGTT